MAVLSCCCCGIFIGLAVSFKTNYSAYLNTVNDYTESTKAISEFTEASDFLTNQVRLFAVNQEPSFMDNYFREIDKLHQRENAISVIQMTHDGDLVDSNVRMALNESYFIQNIEFYSMKLISDAMRMSSARVNPKIMGINLSPEDSQLSVSKKIELARSMLFDSEYLSSKTRISEYCQKANRELANEFIKQENIFYEAADGKFMILVLIGILFFIFIAVFILIACLFFVIPARKYYNSILLGENIQKTGSVELKRIGAAYNSLCEKNALKASVLRHKAEHDPLTGLINRAAFDEIKEILRDMNDPVAYLLIDIDLFKQINDVYGHQTGDLVLKRISALLSEQFRNTDYVARVGGDEFAVIMTKFGNNPSQIIKNKIDKMNDFLQKVTDDLPKVSLSVGVAISPEGYVDELTEQADLALYRVKKGGRCNCSFYEPVKD